MALRLLISDAVWSEIEPVLRELKHAAGSPPVLSDRMFIEAVLYQARTGPPWRDLPDVFGDWNAVYQRFRRWEKRDLWKRLWERIQHSGTEHLKELFIDSTIVRAHQHAAGAPKKRWTTGPGSGSPFATTGGLSTKLHAACTDERTGVSFVLSGGQRNDAVGFEPVWQGLPEALSGLVAAVMDKAYDSNAIRHLLGVQEIEAVIPPRSNRTEAIGYDKEKYKRREKVEWFFNKLKQFRRIATRYEKLSRTFMAFIHIVSTWIMLR